MGRSQKLDDRTKAEIGRRLALGESNRKLAKEFGVGEATIRRTFSAGVSKIKSTATALAEAELELERMPLSAQVTTRTLADQLKGLSQTIIDTATRNGQTALGLAGRGARALASLPENASLDDLRLVAACTDISNKAASLGVSLMNSTKDAAKQGRTLEEILEGTYQEGLGDAIRKARLRVADGIHITAVTGVPEPEALPRPMIDSLDIPKREAGFTQLPPAPSPPPVPPKVQPLQKPNGWPAPRPTEAPKWCSPPADSGDYDPFKDL